MARRVGTGWRTIMRAVAEVGTPMVANQQRLAGVTGVGVDEHAVRHEALLFRMEVRDHHRRAVVAAG